MTRSSSDRALTICTLDTVAVTVLPEVTCLSPHSTRAPVESAVRYDGVLQRQGAHDLVPDCRSRRCGERSHRHPRVVLPQASQLQISRPKVCTTDSSGITERTTFLQTVQSGPTIVKRLACRWAELQSAQHISTDFSKEAITVTQAA